MSVRADSSGVVAPGGGTGGVHLVNRLLRRRPGAAGVALLLPTWVLLGVVLVGYVVAMLALAFVAVLVATLRLLLTPPLTALARALGRAPDPRSLGG